MKHITIRLIISTAFLFSSLLADSQNTNKPNIPGPAGLQVNSFSGGLFYQRTDLYIPGRGLSIDLTFYYNSATTAIDLGYGPGWSMTYSMVCKPDSNIVVIRRANGRKDIFMKSGSVYIAPTGIFDTLIKYQPGKFKLTTKTVINYFFNDSAYHRRTSITG